MPRKRKSKRQSSILEGFAREFTSDHTNSQMRINPKDEISMSDAISQLIEPYREDAPDYNSFRTLVTFACLAWNLSILPRKDHDKMMKQMLALAPANIRDRLDMLGLVTELMDRKKMLFPEVKRMIVEYKVTDLGKNFHIAIASTLEEQDAEK
jgi:hypothetical protein